MRTILDYMCSHSWDIGRPRKVGPCSNHTTIVGSRFGDLGITKIRFRFSCVWGKMKGTPVSQHLVSRLITPAILPYMSIQPFLRTLDYYSSCGIPCYLVSGKDVPLTLNPKP